MYRLRPSLELKEPVEVTVGYEEISRKLRKRIEKNHFHHIAIESYPGIELREFQEKVEKVFPDALITETESLFYSPENIYQELKEDLTPDPVFGRYSHRRFSEFLSPEALEIAKKKINKYNGLVITIGVCASDIISPDLIVYLDIPRREIQKRYKKGLSNWKGYKEEDFSKKLKRANYFEWPAGLEKKEQVLPVCDYFIDMSVDNTPKMINGSDMRKSLYQFIQQPFRLVPFFEPGVWGGHWMQEKFEVGKDEVNLAWCFDGVPEENSIIFMTQGVEIEMPAQNLVSLYPEELLGNKVFGRYGKDFPIRFDFLDTMGGQNLSLQVHPTLDYAHRKFGAKYTQDESYYILDCKENAKVYLGVKENVKLNTLVSELELAEHTGVFEEEQYINSIPVKKHDHLLIPAGTVHSSGSDCVVLEISATPNRYTFKLWDWGRLDLNGQPRPISIHHGKHVINTEFNESFARDELYNNVETLEEKNFIIEKTGLHELESIETHRIIFSEKVMQYTEKSVNMLNLVEGEHIQVKSPTNEFSPFDIYYGETFIIPENVKDYELVPIGNHEAIVMKAFIR
ncbi:class I mannose-6-phosphate isomerase [Alkalibacterium putridalgicola]|uniref:class I mannose-6-phosphate isomerase n=1 Tax=Alkalibacterium putridalgicola TaxID=426703 RepID=UPI0034CEEE3A